MKMPNLPSRYHCGTSNPSSDAHEGWKGPWATTASISFRRSAAVFELVADAGSAADAGSSIKAPSTATPKPTTNAFPRIMRCLLTGWTSYGGEPHPHRPRLAVVPRAIRHGDEVRRTG